MYACVRCFYNYSQHAVYTSLNLNRFLTREQHLLLFGYTALESSRCGGIGTYGPRPNGHICLWCKDDTNLLTDVRNGIICTLRNAPP